VLVNSKNLYRCSLDEEYVESCNAVGGFFLVFAGERGARQGSHKDAVGEEKKTL